MKRWVIAATTRATNAAAIFPLAVILGTRADEKTRNGQCQRYQEYESLPSVWSGAESRIKPSPECGRSEPAISTTTVPATGTSAIQPGKLVSSEKKTDSPQNRERASVSENMPKNGRYLQRSTAKQRRSSSDSELPCSCWKFIESEGAGMRCKPHGGYQRANRYPGEKQHEKLLGSPDLESKHDQQGPEQIELFFYCERPGV